MTDWFRSWHGAPTDNKWLLIGKRASVPPVIVSAIAWALFDHASQAVVRGSVEGFDVETYSVFSGVEEAKIDAVIQAMTEKNLIQNNRLTSWEKRQPQREDGAAQRAREWRERNRTQPNAPERPDTEQNREEEIREEVRVEDAPEVAAKPARGMRLEAFLESTGVDATAQEWGNWSKAEGMPVPMIDAEMAKFRDYWKAVSGGKGCKADWPATWRNWSRRALEAHLKEEKRNEIFRQKLRR